MIVQDRLHRYVHIISHNNCIFWKKSVELDVMKLLPVALLSAMCVLSSTVTGAKILGLFQFSGRSHFTMFEALFKALAAKGHEVTVVGHWPQETPIPNHKDVSVVGTTANPSDSMTIELIESMEIISLMYFFGPLSIKTCRAVLDHPGVQEIIHSDEKFDLMVTELFSIDCFVGLAHMKGVPFISMTSSVPLPWANERVGNPDHSAYIPNYFVPFTDHMTFHQRLVNSIMTFAYHTSHKHFAQRPMYEMAKKYFGDDLPPLWEIAKNTSIVLVNSHFTLNQPRPLVPAVVEVGGMHIQEPKQLPKYLEAYLNESEHGVILFSFGSMVNCSSFHPEKIRAILNAFSKLQQQVIWKVPDMSAYKLPTNVKTVSWIPQLDTLRHPKVRVFITHGGLMGVQEAIHAGVPLVGIPLWADQHQNIEKLVAKGVAIKLNYHDITTESLVNALNMVINNARYKSNAERVSRLFKDRPQTALESAVFWTEYVIRHDGARHLRSAATSLSPFQYHLLDVIAFLFACVLVAISIIYKVIAALLRVTDFICRPIENKERY